MKIAHVLNELKFSGAEMLLTSAAEVLQSTGPATIIATGEQEGVYADVMRAAGYRVLHLSYRKSPAFLLRFRALLKREAFDLVHIHAERCSTRYALVCASLGVPRIRTVHNEFRFIGTQKRRRAITRKLAVSIGTRFVACSPSVRRVEEEEYGVASTVISNWFDPRRVPNATPENRTAARAALGIADDEVLTVSISNEAPAKNLTAIIEGVRSASRDIPRLKHIHLGAVGPELERMAAGLVELHGTRSEVGDYLAACDAFVSTSFNEGGPLVLLEAAAAGAFCITTRVGLAELFDTSPGVRFISPTAESLAAALVGVAAIPAGQRWDDGVLLANLTRSRFGPEVGGQKYVDLYQTLASRSGT